MSSTSASTVESRLKNLQSTLIEFFLGRKTKSQCVRVTSEHSFTSYRNKIIEILGLSHSGIDPILLPESIIQAAVAEATIGFWKHKGRRKSSIISTMDACNVKIFMGIIIDRNVNFESRQKNLMMSNLPHQFSRQTENKLKRKLQAIELENREQHDLENRAQQALFFSLSESPTKVEYQGHIFWRIIHKDHVKADFFVIPAIGFVPMTYKVDTHAVVTKQGRVLCVMTAYRSKDPTEQKMYQILSILRSKCLYPHVHVLYAVLNGDSWEVFLAKTTKTEHEVFLDRMEPDPTFVISKELFTDLRRQVVFTAVCTIHKD